MGADLRREDEYPRSANIGTGGGWSETICDVAKGDETAMAAILTMDSRPVRRHGAGYRWVAGPHWLAH